MDRAAAKAYLKDMQQQKRYLRDVYEHEVVRLINRSTSVFIRLGSFLR